jgi:hypothetical protein
MEKANARKVFESRVRVNGEEKWPNNLVCGIENGYYLIESV